MCTKTEHKVARPINEGEIFYIKPTGQQIKKLGGFRYQSAVEGN